MYIQLNISGTELEATSIISSYIIDIMAWW